MKALWENVKAQIRSELSQNSFSLWIDPLSFVEAKEDRIFLGCPNRFSRNWVMENYFEMIRETFQRAAGRQLDVVLMVEPHRREAVLPPDAPGPEQLPLPAVPPRGGNGRIRLNGGFTFDRFVVGRSNEFAYSASLAMAQEDSWNYQSLLMLAHTGLGKTHLSQAVGHCILKNKPRSRVYYMTAEDFTNEMISALKNNRIEAFKNKYRRGCDVLLLEGIHFLSGKEKTQVELGYTLDALANDNKKIIFTSSLAPKDIPRISKNLSSRLTSGLVTSIERPDYDTRSKILEKKASEHGLALSKEIVHLLATRLTRDIRQMECAVKCLKAKTELLKEKTDLAMVTEVLSCLSSPERSITPQDIGKLVATYYKIDPGMLSSKSRKKLYAYPRNIYVYLCRRYTDETVETIAKTINRSHSAVLYASELVDHNMRTDTKMKHQILFLEKKLGDIKK